MSSTDHGRETAELSIRRATDQDRSAIIDLCRASLGWERGDPNEEFFAWKHDRNPFGASPAWIAEASNGVIAGLRVFLRWKFTTTDGQRISAVRAVDTATHPDWRGRGIFTKLTMGAIEELADDGLDVVFNTPNDQSRPGYLKMGWQVVGRVPVAVRVRSIRSVPRLAGARAAAEMWSQDVDVASDARDLLADSAGLSRLLERVPTVPRIHTPRDPEFLQWRYDFEPLHYRVMPLGDSIDAGLIIFRVRSRGTATELTICDVLAPGGAPVRRAIGHLLRTSGADYAIRTMGPGVVGSGFLPAPNLGPVLTWREVTRSGIPAIDDLAFVLGDIELF